MMVNVAFSLKNWEYCIVLIALEQVVMPVRKQECKTVAEVDPVLILLVRY